MRDFKTLARSVMGKEPVVSITTALDFGLGLSDDNLDDWESRIEDSR